MNIVAEIKKHLEMAPFRPFAVRTADGHEYPVPTIDHVYLPPGGTGAIIADDQGVTIMIPARLMSGSLQNSAVPENDASS